MEIREKIVGIIRAQVNDINEKLIEAKLEFADCSLSETEWHNKNDRKIDCKMYQAQIEALLSIEGLIEDILIPKPMGAAV